MMDAVDQAPEKPESYSSQAEDLLKEPTTDKCVAFAAMMLGLLDPGISFEQALSLFVHNNERNWIDQTPPLADL